MPKLERTITVEKSLDQVWDFLTDFTNTVQWDPPTVSTDRISGDGTVGTVYRNVSRILGHDTEIEYTVVEVEPKSLFRLAGRTSSMKMLDTMHFAEAGGAVTVTYTVLFEPQGAARLIEPLMPLGLKKLGDDAAAQMRKVLEQI